MRIAFDARPLIDAPSTPQSVRLVRLYETLAEVRPDWDLIGYHQDPKMSDGAYHTASIQFNHIEARSAHAWNKRMFATAKAEGADIIHTPTWCTPPRTSVDTVVSIDHLLPWEMTSCHSLQELSQFQNQIRRTCKRATRIVCPTSHIRETLINEFDAIPASVSVVTPAFDTFTEQVQPDQWKPVLDRYGVNRPFVLHFGPDEKRRNTRKLIEAWAMSDGMIRNALQLVIVGVSDNTGKELAAVVNRLGLDNSVRLLRWFNEPNDQQTLLSAADIVAMPYLAEGFPEFCLKAWSARAAILTSEVSGIKRVAANAALYADPHDSCAIARGIKRLVVDGRMRRQFIVKGEQRVKQFSWQHTAENFAREIERTKGILVSLQPASAEQLLRRAA
jgi:glycosyltransferase involved in cell wall biosynthesis